MIKNFILLFLFNFIKLNPICIGGENHCLRCNTITNLCIKCDKDIYSPDEKGGCGYSKKCVVGNHYCFECTEEGNLCKICEEGYFQDENGGCSYTPNCEISYKGECIKCKDNYILIGTDDYLNEGLKICKSLNSEDFKNCKQINATKGACIECNEGYYLNIGDSRCSDTQNCYESIFGTCKLCMAGHYLNKKNNKCIKQDDNFFSCKESLDGKICDSCEDDYFFDENKKCTLYNYCAKIGPVHSCEKCIDGYFLSEYDKVCTFDEHCYYGHKDTGICFTCQNNYYLEKTTGHCISNQEENDFKNCKMSENNKCIQCIYGYYIGSDNKCSNSKYCFRTEKGKCLECTDDHYLGLDNICNVKHCIYSNYNECTECEDGFYYDKVNITCFPYEDNIIFKNCKYTNYADKCSACKNDFYLNRTDYLCYSNKEKGDFYKCAISSEGDYCIECIDGYYTDDNNKCVNSQGCEISENENKCLKCKDYYCLDVKTGKCFDNDIIVDEEKKFYFRCNRTNEEGTKCEECIDGFSVNKDGICVNDSYCSERNEEGICLKCKNDEQGIFCLNNIFECVEIFFNENCLICNNIFDFDNCTKSLDGFELNEKNECI